MPHIICVGAVYMDTILSVPHFPEEDTKLRATRLVRRRGGNTGNTLEVISQLLQDDNLDPDTSVYETELSLLTVLPDKKSLDTAKVIQSLPDVSTRLFLYRPGQELAASSYIIQPADTKTRTIVSANPLAEMTFEEFRTAIEPLITPDVGTGEVWIHFEGRVPEVLLQCVSWLRRKYGYHEQVKISVECEKPDRTGLKDVAALADVVFYSRLWAEATGDPNICAPPVTAYSFLDTQTDITLPHALLICTWGSSGAEALRKIADHRPIRASCPGWRPHPRPSTPQNPRPGEPVDTVGAGDTFIAGMLYALVEQSKWGIDERLSFANELAGRKVYRDGFSGLGEEIRGSAVWGAKLGGSA